MVSPRASVARPSACRIPPGDDYLGPTVVEEGAIEISQNAGIIAIPGDIDIGLAAGDSPAYLEMVNGENVIAASSRMRVFATGSFDVRHRSQSLASLTIAGGYVNVGRTSMTGGFLSAGACR